jgi:hypothetical protein
VLKIRAQAFGEGGCPVAVVTDNIRRDVKMLSRLLGTYFPAAMSRVETQTVLCQDPIHRQWHVTRVLPKMHPDYGCALSDIKAIFGRVTYVTVAVLYFLL